MSDLALLPNCDQRGRRLGNDRCFCRHAVVAGGAKSTVVPQQQCVVCPYPVDGSDPPTEQARPVRVALAMSPAGTIRLGDRIQSALSAVGITQTRVAKWLGSCLGCADRQAKLNSLSGWAEQTAHVALAESRQQLQRLLGSAGKVPPEVAELWPDPTEDEWPALQQFVEAWEQ